MTPAPNSEPETTNEPTPLRKSRRVTVPVPRPAAIPAFFREAISLILLAGLPTAPRTARCKKNRITHKNVADTAPYVKAGRVKKFMNFSFDKAQIQIIIFL
jgi:hypothetical protein